MISIGPYVVVREISTRQTRAAGDPSTGHAPAREGSAGKTYRATDRLTGIPVLLHALPTMMATPQVPASPALLPFTDIVVNAGEAFLVTELPPNAVPARDPLLAARGALEALTVLHEHGLAHGGLDTAQLWSVDGPVRLAGGGLRELSSEYSVARDLQDLAYTLDQLGGLPPALALLRTEPEHLSARETLLLLEAGEGHLPEQSAAAPQPVVLPAALPVSLPTASNGRGVRFQPANSSAATSTATQASLPNLNPLSLLNHSAPLPQQGTFLSQAVWTSEEQPSASSTDPGTTEPPETTRLPFKLDVAQWDYPAYLRTDAPHAPLERPETAPERTSSLGWAEVNRPLEQRPQPEVTTQPDPTLPPPEESSLTRQGRKARAAASRAFDRLRADGQRQRQLQEIRRDQTAARLGELSGQHDDSRLHQMETLASEAVTLPDEGLETPQERRRREYLARQEEEQLAEQVTEKIGVNPAKPVAAAMEEERTPAEHRQLKAVKMRWNEKTNSWQKVDAAQPPRQALPLWLWPALAAAALLLIFVATRARPAQPASATSQPSCCTVDFKVTGGGNQATVSILNTTSKGQWHAGQVIGTVPGQLHLPGEGTYKLNVASQGFTPATLDVTVPARGTVTIKLGP